MVLTVLVSRESFKKTPTILSSLEGGKDENRKDHKYIEGEDRELQTLEDMTLNYDLFGQCSNRHAMQNTATFHLPWPV